MGYQLRGLITRVENAAPIAQSLGVEAKVVPLTRGFALIPYTHAVYDGFNAGRVSARVRPFWWLGELLADLCAEASGNGPLAYVEAEYFGGAGDQKAVLWQDGGVLFGPVTTGRIQPDFAVSKTAISQVLARLGVGGASAARDEFTVLGLGRFRHWEGWDAADSVDATAIEG